jgi:hypothetical protein
MIEMMLFDILRRKCDNMTQTADDDESASERRDCIVITDDHDVVSAAVKVDGSIETREEKKKISRYLWFRELEHADES